MYVLLSIFLSLIFINLMTIYFLYTLKHSDQCNKTELITIMYDYYIFETITIVLLALTLMYLYRRLKDKMISTIFRSVVKYSPNLNMIKFILISFIVLINALMLRILYDVYQKKECVQLNPYLSNYLLWNQISTSFGIIFLIYITYN